MQFNSSVGEAVFVSYRTPRGEEWEAVLVQGGGSLANENAANEARRK